MTPSPPRRFWQIHLSTAIVMMFVAAGLLYLNLVPRERHLSKLALIPGPRYGECMPWILSHGWPAAIVDGIEMSQGTNVVVVEFTDYQSIIVNISVALAILVSVSVLCERHLRRRK